MPLKSFRDRNRIGVGLASLTVLGLLLVSVFLIGTQGLFRDRYSVRGVFTETGGVRPGDEVRVAGVRVGEVTVVKPDFARGNVVITWEVDGGIELGRDTRAEIKTANVLGGRFLRLSGPVERPYLEELPPARRLIPENRTETPTTVNDALKTTTDTVNRLDTKAISNIVDELAGVNPTSQARLGRALRNLGALAETIDENDPKIRELLDNGDRILAMANAKDEQLSRLLDNVKAMLVELDRRRTELSAFLGSGNKAVRDMTTLIDEQQARLVAVVNDLSATLRTLRPAGENLNELLAWAGPTLTGLSGVGGYGPWLEVVATGLGPLSPQDLADLVAGSKKGGR